MASAAEVRTRLAKGDWALLKRESYAEVVASDSMAYPIVAASGGWTLVHAAPRPEVVLEPREPYR